MEEDTKFCSNCKKDISASNFVMHEMHCRRHIVLCDRCSEPVRRTDLEQHINDLHAEIACERCQQKVCKPDMAKHLDKECVKRPVKCEFCELAQPRDQLDSHMDYCGSRTECCPLCQQYIMLKDQLQHETSSCSYPEPKPQPQPQQVDPFNMEDLQEIMNGAAVGPVRSAMTTTALGNTRRRRNRNSNLDVNSTQGERDLLEKSYFDPTTLPPDMDYDTMLAIQMTYGDFLEGGDGPGENIFSENIHQAPGPPSYLMSLQDDVAEDWTPSQAQTQNSTNRTFQEEHEEQSIPCEFCFDSIPLSSYVEHLELCTEQAFAQTGPSSDLNNETLPSTQQFSSRPAIPVINNLRTPTNAQPSSGELINDGSIGLDGDFMLPCEFCDEIFPSEIIFEHQNVCAASGLATPRATTPATTNRPPPAPSSINPVSSKQSIQKSRPRRQPDPALIDFADDDEGGGIALSGWDVANNNRVQKMNVSSIDKYSPSVNRFDDAVARPPPRPSRQSSQASSDAGESAGPPWPERRPNKSAQRARTRLNQLLQEDQSNGASGSRETSSSTRKTTVPLAGRDMNRAEPKTFHSRVDSRTVQRQLDQGSRRTSQKSSSKPSANQSQSSQEDGGQNAPARSRRRDQLFSPELRLKPDHNPPSQKR